MIHLHRPKHNPFSDKIERELEELVVAHKIHRYGQPTDGKHLPYVEENGRIVSGTKEIEKYLQELKTELRQQRMVTGDGCYIDPDTGETC